MDYYHRLFEIYQVLTTLTENWSKKNYTLTSLLLVTICCVFIEYNYLKITFLEAPYIFCFQFSITNYDVSSSGSGIAEVTSSLE